MKFDIFTMWTQYCFEGENHIILIEALNESISSALFQTLFLGHITYFLGSCLICKIFRKCKCVKVNRKSQ